MTNMKDMFEEANSFNQPLNNWNVSNVVGVAARPTDSDDHSIDLRQVEQDVFYLGAKPSLGI